MPVDILPNDGDVVEVSIQTVVLVSSHHPSLVMRSGLPTQCEYAVCVHGVRGHQ